MAKKIMSTKHLADLQKSLQKSSNNVIYAPLSKSVCAAMLAGAMVLGGGVFISPAPAYADGYVAPDGNIYYGYKSDANYSKDRFKIEVHYYSTKEAAEKDDANNQDPLGQYVHVKYTANLNDKHEFDKWAFRPMWWYGVPAGLTNVHNVIYSRFEKYTKEGKPDTAPSTTTPGIRKDSENTTKHYKDSKDWKSISRFYVDNPSQLKSMNGLGMLLGVDGNKNNGYDSNGTTAGNWSDFYAASKGMQGMFIDWESAGKRFYEMDYVAELTDDAWQKRDEHPLRFAAGVYRFAGNWHIATGQIHRAPKIADSLKVQYPDRTPVAKLGSVTEEEQGKVKKAITDANEKTPHFSNLLDGDAGITVDENGTATLTFKDKTTLTMPGDLLVMEQKQDCDLYPPTYPAPIPVVNTDKPNAEEQKAIINAIKDANKSNKNFTDHVNLEGADTFTFDDQGKQLKIKYNDKSELAIPYSSLVYQGATIADWAPYVVPDPIDVVNPSSLTEQEKTQVTNAFDKANADLDVYTAAKKNGNTPVSFDKDFKNAIITWADGSKSTIPSWQFLTKKAEQAPTPKPPTPNPTEEKKTFTVDLPSTPTQVTFDPFDKSATVATDVITSLQNQLKGRTAKDANDPSKSVTIKSATISIANGTVTFTADGYADKVYPIGIFYKKRVTGTGTQNPTQQTPTSKTDTDPNNNKNTYKYFVTKTQINESKVSDVTPQEVVKALKQFVRDNYTGWTEQELEHVTGNVSVDKNWKAKAGTTNLEPFNKGNGRITSISVSNDNGLTVNGYQYADQEDANIDVSTDGPLFTISADDLYAPNGGSQTPTDNTIENLRKLAQQIRDQRKKDGDLTDDVITTLGATDDKINSMTDEKALRDLIKKIADYQKPKPVEYKYNFEKLTLDHEGDLTDADYKKIVVEQFLKKNYTTNDWSKLEKDYSNKTVALSGNNSNTYGLTTVASGTSGLNIYTGDKQAGGVTSVGIDSNGNLVVRGWKAGSSSQHADVLITIKKADLFTPKSKDQNPTPSAEDLQQMKNDAKKIIDKNPYLTPKQKEDYKKQIDSASDQKGIQKILNDAKVQGEKNKKNTTDPEVQRIINNNKGGGDEKKQHELQAAKEAAKNAIEALTHLSNEEKKEFEKQLDGDTVKTPAEVQKIVDAAKLADELKGAKDGAQKAEFVFLDHGTAKGEDAALNELLGGTSAKCDELKKLDDLLKKTNPAATAEEINTALAAAQRQNAINESNAKNAGIAKLEAKKAELDAAYNALPSDKQTQAKKNYDDAITAITNAESAVNKATKPSEIKKDVDGVDTSLNAAKEDIKNNTPKRDTTGNTNDPDATTFQSEKDKAKKEIDDIPGLSKEEKDKYKEQINQSTHKGDPEAIVNQAKKHKKIEAALKAIDDFKNLNNAQKETFKKIIEDTDAHDRKDDKGNVIGDDIDDALANAANTDNAMARLDELKKKADEFANGDAYKNSNDANKKKAFDDASTAAGAVLDKAKGDDKNADQVNELYNDLLKAMRDIDPQAKSAGLKTDALSKEIELDKKLKPDTTATPATKGDSVYTTASKDKKDAFDAALTAAEQALKDASKEDLDISTADKEAEQQRKIDDALDKLIKARLALDGVDTKPLQDEIDKDSKVKDSDRYTYSTTTDKKTAFDKALQAAKDLIDKLTGKKKASADDHLDTKENKQKALDDALAKLKEAEKALDGKKPAPTPVPTPVNPTPEPVPTPAPSPVVDKSHLQQGINGSGDVHDSDDYNNAPSDKKQAYDHALDHANEVNKDPNATQDQVNQAAEDLKKAQQDLHDSATVDKSYLQWEVSDDVAFRGRGSYLVADASLKDAYKDALSEARSVLSDPNATQAQVNAALAKLREAKRNILQANGLSGEEYAGDGTPGTDNNGSTPGTGNTGAGNTGAGNTGSTPGTGNTGAGNTGAGNTGTVPGSSVVPGGSSVVPGTVPGSVPGSGNSGFGSTGSTNAGTTNSGSGHEGDSSHGFGVNDNAPTTVDKGELNLQIEGAESGSKPGSNSGAAGNGSNSAAGSNASAGTTGAAGNAAAGAAGAAGNAAGSNAGNAAAGSAAANGLAAAKVNAVVENSKAVKRADAQVAAAEAAVNTALAEAKKVAADPNATQAQVDAAAQKLADARKSLAAAQDNASRVRAVVREQVLKRFKGSKLSKTGSDVSVFGVFAAGVAAAGAALFLAKRRGISRHCSK